MKVRIVKDGAIPVLAEHNSIMSGAIVSYVSAYRIMDTKEIDIDGELGNYKNRCELHCNQILQENKCVLCKYYEMPFSVYLQEVLNGK